MSVEMQQLRHLCALSEQRHYGKAAAALSISQPALTRSIQNLESRLGVRLLERSRSGLIFTPYGEILLERAQFVLNEVRRAEEEIGALAGRIVGTCTFGATPSFDHFVLPEVIASLVRQNASIQLLVKSGFYEDLLDLVRTGAIDFAVALVPELHGHPEVREEVVMNARFRVHCRPRHPLASTMKASLNQLAQHGWIVPDQPASRQLDRWFESLRAHRPRLVIRTASMGLLKSTLRHSDLLSIMAEHLAYDEVARRELMVLSVPELERTQDVALLTRRTSSLSPIAQQLMDGIRRACVANVAPRPIVRRRR